MIDAADARLQGSGDDLSRWWTVFKDPTLDGFDRLGLSTEFDAARRRLSHPASSRANERCARQLLSADAGNDRRYLREAVSRNSANRSFVGTRFFDQWDYGFNLAWELVSGRFRRAIESAVRT